MKAYCVNRGMWLICLYTTSMSFESPLTGESPERARTLAELYPQFPHTKPIHDAIRSVLERGETDERAGQELRDLYTQLEQATSVLELSLQNQKDYKLADKRWIRTPEMMEAALQRGRLAMELDLRQDANGGFWISHATGAKSSFAPPYVHELETEKLKAMGTRTSLEHTLDTFRPYQPYGHKLILEVKDLGAEPSEHHVAAERLAGILREHGVSESCAVSSLSPTILMNVHRAMPDMPLILNGGIVPCISYTGTDASREHPLIPKDGTWNAFGVKPFGELVVSATEEIIERPDGHGMHTAYLMTKLPKQLLDVLRSQHQNEAELGGIVSLSGVTIVASLLDVIGAKKRASELRTSYAQIMDELGVGTMATTWGQGGGFLLKRLKPERQVEVFKRELGEDALIYAKSPEEWAHTLQEKSSASSSERTE